LPAETYRYAETLCQRPAQPFKWRSGASSGFAWRRCMGGSGRDRPTRRHGSLPCGCAGGSRCDRCLSSFRLHGWASGDEGQPTGPSARDAPVDSRARPLVAAVTLLELGTVETFYYMQGSALPHPPVRAKVYFHGRWTGIPRRCWQRSRRRRPGEDGQSGSRFAGLRQECGIHLPWRDGRGHLRWGVPGPLPHRLAGLLIGTAAGALGRGGRQAPPPAALLAQPGTGSLSQRRASGCAAGLCGQPAPKLQLPLGRRFHQGRRGRWFSMPPWLGVEPALAGDGRPGAGR